MSLVPVVQAAGVVGHMISFLPLHTIQPWFMDIITFRKFLSISRLCEVEQRKLFLGLISNAFAEFHAPLILLLLIYLTISANWLRLRVKLWLAMLCSKTFL